MIKDRTKNWIYVILWMALIFYFSSQIDVESSKNNAFFIKILSSFGLNLDNILGEGFANLIVRKAAHILEFLILYLLFIRAFLGSNFKYAYSLSFLCCFLYAASDEFHQTFVEGRYGCFRDVLIDSFLPFIITMVYNLGKGLKNKGFDCLKRQ